MMGRLRRLREAAALWLAPWLERPEPPSTLDLRGGPPITEVAARAMGGAFLAEAGERGREVADHVTVLYAPPEGLRPDGSGYRVTSAYKEASVDRA